MCILQLLEGDAVILRSEPRSRTALIGEQPNPWDLLQPQDATIRHRTCSIIPDGVDYIFTLLSVERGAGVLWQS